MLEAVLLVRRVGETLGECLQHSQLFKSQITIDSYCLYFFNERLSFWVSVI